MLDTGQKLDIYKMRVKRCVPPDSFIAYALNSGAEVMYLRKYYFHIDKTLQNDRFHALY